MEDALQSGTQPGENPCRTLPEVTLNSKNDDADNQNRKGIVIITAFHENAQINDSDGGNSHNNIMFRTGKVNPAGGATEQCKIDP